MTTWTIEDQENCVKSAITSAAFLSWLTGFHLLKDITLLWFELTTVSEVIGAAIILPLIYFMYKMWQQPKLLSYGWRLREICGDFQDEYLRSRFQRATTLAFQLTILVAFLGYVASELVLAKGDPQWLSYKLVPLLTVFVGMLSFYLSLRNVLDEQDEPAEQPPKDHN